MLYWRIAHFYFIHRAMHPWWHRSNGLRQGDVGAFLYRHVSLSPSSSSMLALNCSPSTYTILYRHVHAHHHQSYNPTSFSGFSMTPVESVLYMSAALIPLCFRCGCHPFIVLYTKMDLIIGAQIGHDGFDAPGGGSYYHQLHHAHFDCNYGDAAFPMDWIVGSFKDGSEFDKKSKVALD
jgi:hypothetical protein